MLKLSFLFLSFFLGCTYAQATCNISIEELIDYPETTVIFSSKKNNTTVYCNSADDYGTVEYYVSVSKLADANDFRFDNVEIELGFVDVNRASEFNQKILQLSTTEKGRKLALWALSRNSVTTEAFDVMGFRLSNITSDNLGVITLDASKYSDDSLEQQVDGHLLSLKYEYLLTIYFGKSVSVGSDKDIQEADLIRLMNKNFKTLLDQSTNILMVSVNLWPEYQHLSTYGSGHILLINPKLFKEM